MPSFPSGKATSAKDWKFDGRWMKDDGSGPDSGLRYRRILATILRMKRKDRVVPKRQPMGMDFSKQRAAEYPGSKPLSQEDPPDCPYDCPLECESCFSQFFPAEIGISDAEALTRVKNLSQSIHSDRMFLQYALQHHADLIATRWHKKSKVKRSELLSRLFEKYSKGVTFEDDNNTKIVGLHDKKWAAIDLNAMHSDDPVPAGDKLMKKWSKDATSSGEDDAWREGVMRDIVMGDLEYMVKENFAKSCLTTWLLPCMILEDTLDVALLVLRPTSQAPTSQAVVKVERM